MVLQCFGLGLFRKANPSTWTCTGVQETPAIFCAGEETWNSFSRQLIFFIGLRFFLQLLNYGQLCPLDRTRAVDFAVQAWPCIGLEKFWGFFSKKLPFLARSGSGARGQSCSVTRPGDRAAVWQGICFVSDPPGEILPPSSHTLHTCSCSFLPAFDSLCLDVIITLSVAARVVQRTSGNLQ